MNFLEITSLSQMVVNRPFHGKVAETSTCDFEKWDHFYEDFHEENMKEECLCYRFDIDFMEVEVDGHEGALTNRFTADIYMIIQRTGAVIHVKIMELTDADLDSVKEFLSARWIDMMKNWEPVTICPEETFEQALAGIINKYSRENNSNTPDHLLAAHLIQCLDAFELTSRAREEWYGVSLVPGAVIKDSEQ